MYKRILVPLDGSETAEKVLPVVTEEARCHGAAVVVLRVIPPPRSSLMVTPKFQEQLLQQATEFTHNYLAGVAQRLRSEGLEVQEEIRSGPPAQRILDCAEETGCDLIIIGSRGETSALKWPFGGTAHKVVKAHTARPVLVVST